MRIPLAAIRSRFGVGISDPKQPRSEYPRSSARITTIFGRVTWVAAHRPVHSTAVTAIAMPISTHVFNGRTGNFFLIFESVQPGSGAFVN
jgi:hypothetical protein